MANIEIKRVTINQIDQLQKIGRQTFSETFSPGNSEEDMETYLNEGFSIEKLSAEIAATNSKFYFAILDDTIIGYVKVNLGTSQTESKAENTLEIERIYVLKEFHGKTVGQQLYEKAMEIAKETSVTYVWLGVWEKNSKAIRFYEKNGFKAFDTHIFRLGNDKQTDILMKHQMKQRRAR